MRIKVHQDIEGVKSGQTVDVPEKRAKWLIAEGYASTAADSDGVHATSVDAKLDPTLAENNDSANDSLAEQMAAGLGKPGEVDPDPVDSQYAGPPNPIEVTNGNGDPEKAEKGKAGLEAAAEKTDPEDAPETNPEAVADAQKANDKAEAKVQKVEAAKEDADTTEEAAEAAAKVAKRRRS
jgi:hypothetical protein